MSEPTISAKTPLVVELEAGDYWWCTCGNTSNQAFCDGSHQDTGFKPMKVTLDKKQTVALCQCKQTGNPPFCDGAHAKL
jgi:prepilin-type processing-associated H-X9-DG protein